MKAEKRQKPDNYVVIRAKSVPAGIDWRMIREMKERTQFKKAS